MGSVFRVIRAPGLCLLVLLGCGTEPDYPEFDGPAPTVSHFGFSGDQARAVVRDPQGAATIGRDDYTYVYFYREGTQESQVSFAGDWTWTQVDALTWRVTVPDLTQDWSAATWHVADVEANVQMYQCANDGTCVAVEQPV